MSLIEKMKVVAELMSRGVEPESKEGREAMYGILSKEDQETIDKISKETIQKIIMDMIENFTSKEFFMFEEMVVNEAEHMRNMQEKKTEVKSPSHTHVPEKSCLNCNVKDYIDKENFVIKSYEELKDLCQKCDDLSNWEVLIEKMCTNCKSHDVDMSECLMNQHSDKICLKGELWELKIN